MRILVAEDHEDIAYLLERILKVSGHEVVITSNGIEALDRLKYEKFDMIISDILMPVMDGFIFCRVVKNDDNLKNIPFVIYSASYTDDRDKEFGFKLGADFIIEAPIEPHIFSEIIENISNQIKSEALGPKLSP